MADIGAMPTPTGGENIKIYRNWRAKRSGTGITITGIENGIENPTETKVSNIVSMEPGPRGSSYVIATDKDGTQFNLRID